MEARNERAHMIFAAGSGILLGLGLGLRQTAPEFLIPLGWLTLFWVVGFAYWWGATWLWRRAIRKSGG